MRSRRINGTTQCSITWQQSATVLVLLASAYVALQMIADISSLKLTEVAGFAVDGGTLAASGWYKRVGRESWTNRPRKP